MEDFKIIKPKDEGFQTFLLQIKENKSLYDINLENLLNQNNFTDLIAFAALYEEKSLKAYCALEKYAEFTNQKFKPFISNLYIKNNDAAAAQILLNQAILYLKQLKYHKAYISTVQKNILEKFDFSWIAEDTNLQGTWNQIYVRYF